MSRVLVTGGAGSIGRAVCLELASAGHDVLAYDALLPSVHPSGTAVDLDTGVELQVADVRDRAAMDRALRGVDVVCHQAAMVGMGLDRQDTPDYVGCNDLGTAVLLAACQTREVARLVLASSMAAARLRPRPRRGAGGPPRRRPGSASCRPAGVQRGGRYRAGDVRHITASSARAVAELGYAPTTGFEVGMAAFAAEPLHGG